MSIFKESFHPQVAAQLKARQNALIDRTNPVTVQYYNARNAWVRMTSAVNVGPAGGTSGLAENYKLLGGVLLNGEPRVGVGVSGGAYSVNSPGGVTQRLGMRPMPGITEINVKSLGAYGSLKEVEVKFNAWDIRQLEDLELLYMRPGYSVLVEWGWAPYLKDATTLESNPDFINSIFSDITKEAIWKEIYTKSTSGTGGNYDAVYGFVKNYSWSARADGGYDCSTTLITMGEILESLKVNYGPFVDKAPDKPLFGILDASYFGKDSTTAKAYSQNIIAGICSELYETVKKYTIANFSPFNFLGWNFYRYDVDTANKTNQTNTIVSDSANIYIALKDFVDVLNKHVLISDIKAQKPLLELSVFCGEHNGGTTTPLTCLGDIQQLSTDPTVCLIKNTNWVDPGSSLGIVVSSSDIADLQKIMGSLELDYWYNGFGTTQLGIIGNIYVNLDYIYSLVTNANLESQDKKEKNDVALYDFIKNMMSGINTAIGSVATFELHTDPVDSIVRIIDVNYTGNRTTDWANAAVIEIQKLGSIVRSYQLESQIFPEQSTMVAIGAQAQGGALGENVNTMIDFNRNLTDRIIPVKDSPRAPKTTVKTAAEIKAESEEKEKVRKENLSVLIDFIAKLDADWWESKGDFDAGEASKYSNALKDQINYYRNNTDADNKNRAIIPTKLSIEMDGISGMIIGNIFRIPEEVLPKGYRGVDGIGPEKLAYVVTGLGHSVQNNDWKTKIDSQFIILDDPKGGMSTGDSKAIKAGNKNVSEDKGILEKIVNKVEEGIEDAKRKVEQIINGGEPPKAPVKTTGTGCQALTPNISSISDSELDIVKGPFTSNTGPVQELAVIDGKPVGKDVVKAIILMKRAAKIDNIDLRVNSGFRSPYTAINKVSTKGTTVTAEAQDTLYAKFLKRGKPLTAAPGTSPHGYAIAFDLNTGTVTGAIDTVGPLNKSLYQWLITNAYKFGFVRYVAKEEWHWQYMPGTYQYNERVPRDNNLYKGMNLDSPCDKGKISSPASSSPTRQDNINSIYCGLKDNKVISGAYAGKTWEEYKAAQKVTAAEENTAKQSCAAKDTVEAVLIGGLDSAAKGYYTISEQLAIFKEGFGDRNVKAYSWTTPVKTITDFLKTHTNIPVIMFSAGCIDASSIADVPNINKSKIYIIEPYAIDAGTVKIVKAAVQMGVPEKNVYVGPNVGVGSGVIDNPTLTNSSKKGSDHGVPAAHWDALRIIGRKIK
jgi:hypothetical protein